MDSWHVRDFHDSDLDRVVQLEEEAADTAAPPAFPMTEVITALRRGEPAVVAVVSGAVVGAAVATVAGERAWVVRLLLARAFRQRGLGSSLLRALESRLVSLGVRRMSALLPAGETGSAALTNSAFFSRADLVYYDKLEQRDPGEVGVLERLGGRPIPPGLWEGLGGMDQEKELIERRVILPLAEPERAARFGVVPPRTVIMFGPPGTGKTTFAKGVASRLGWPFVELFPSRLAAGAPAELAKGLREVFAELSHVERVVVFIDEVEEIAAARGGLLGSIAHSVTNELLKAIPAFRDSGDKLLVCATNAVHAIDPALLRPGRFDYVIPVGPPDLAARLAIWNRYLGTAAERIDPKVLAEQSELLTPADIEHAARTAAQLAFERAETQPDTRVELDDYLVALARTRPTLTPEMISTFEHDIEVHARL